MKATSRHVFLSFTVAGRPLAECRRCGVLRRLAFVVGRGATQSAIVLYRVLGTFHWTTERPLCRKS